MEVQKEVPTPNPPENEKPALKNEQASTKTGMKIINSVIPAVATGIMVLLFVTGSGYIWIFAFLACVFYIG